MIAAPVLIVAISSLFAVAGEAGLTVNVEFVCRETCPASLRVIATSNDAGVPPAEWRVSPASGAKIEVGNGTVWRLRAEASGVWLRDVTLTSDDDGRTIRWTVWPAVSLGGTLDRAPSNKPVLTIRPLQNHESAPDFVEARVECDVTKVEFRCAAPSVPFDARIGIDGFGE